MKIVYMGTPDFAVPSLEALVRAGHEVACVVTQPDAVRDRGKKIKYSPVKEKALELGIPVLQPVKVRKDAEFLQQMQQMQQIARQNTTTFRDIASRICRRV